MRWTLLQHLSIKWKLTLIMSLLATIISISEIILYTAHDSQTYINEKRIKTHIIAEIIGANIIAPLKFAVRDDALEILNSLRAEKTIRLAYLFDQTGGLLGEYVREGEILSIPLTTYTKKSEGFDKESYYLIHPIILDNEQIGALYLSSDLEDLRQRKRENILFGGMMGIIFLLISLLLAIWLQKAFTKPIHELTTVTKQITERKDYSLRVSLSSHDEFRVLGNGLNHMLSEIEQRDTQLAHQMNLLEKTNKELDQFVYVASHDLKAPLRAVENLSRMIVKATKDLLGADQKELLDLLQNRIKRMEHLLDDLLTYSRIGRIQSQIETVHCGNLLRDIVELLDPPKTFTVTIPPDLPILRTEKTPLEQVFRNLIGNAIKHHNRADGHISILFKDFGTYTEFGISDDGLGISPEYHEKIFQMFQTLRPRDEVEGSGMGLAMVKKIVEEHKGKIWLVSEEGRGSTFYFTWPKGD